MARMPIPSIGAWCFPLCAKLNTSSVNTVHPIAGVGVAEVRAPSLGSPLAYIPYSPLSATADKQPREVWEDSKDIKIMLLR